MTVCEICNRCGKASRLGSCISIEATFPFSPAENKVHKETFHMCTVCWNDWLFPELCKALSP